MASEEGLVAAEGAIAEEEEISEEAQEEEDSVEAEGVPVADEDTERGKIFYQSIYKNLK